MGVISGRRARAAWVVGGVVAAAILGLVVGVRLPEAPPRAADRPNAPSPAATAAATASGISLAPSADDGLVVDLGGHGIGLRTEADPTPYFRVDNRTKYAVSQDGRLASWRTGPDDALPHELHVYDTRTRSDRTVLTLHDERAGAAGFLVWSTDGQGIALAVHDARSVFEGRNAPAPPTTSSLRLLDVASGQQRSAGSIQGAWLVPLSWDRESGLVAATEVGRAAPTGRTPDNGARLYAYSDSARTFLEVAAPSRIDPLSIHVDSASDWALALERTACADPPCPVVLWTWPLRDPYVAQKHTVGVALMAAFRPGTRDVFALVRINKALLRIVDLGTFGAAAPREVLALSKTPGTFLFRQDGGAIVVPNPDPNSRTGSVVDPENRVSALPMVAGGDVVATIGGTPARPAAVAAFPESWTLVGTTDGRVQRGVGGIVIASWKVCDGWIGSIVVPAGDSSTVLVVCQVGEPRNEPRGFLLQADLFATSSQGRVTPLPGFVSMNAAFSPDGRTLIYTSLAPGDPGAPISKMRVWMLDVGQGRIGTPREILTPDYNLGEVRWTTLGPSVFKPQRSPNGIRRPADAGTFLYDGTSWRRYSLHRLVDATSGPQGHALLEVEPAGAGAPQPRGAAVLLREGERETQLTPGDVGDERALALLDDGHVLAWRRDRDEYHGTVVTYADGHAVRQDSGAFSAILTFRAGLFADAIVGEEISGPPMLLTLRSYSIADHTFAAVAPGSVSAVSALVVARSRR